MFYALSVGYSIFVNIRRGDFRFYFIYLTHLNLCATMVATFLGAFLVTLHHLEKLKAEKGMSTAMKFYWALWNQSIEFSCQVSIFYWATIHNGETINLNNVLIHITNSIVLIIDAFVVKHPVKHSNVIFIFLAVIFYVIFTIVYQLLGGLNK